MGQWLVSRGETDIGRGVSQDTPRIVTSVVESVACSTLHSAKFQALYSVRGSFPANPPQRGLQSAESAVLDPSNSTGLLPYPVRCDGYC